MGNDSRIKINKGERPARSSRSIYPFDKLNAPKQVAGKEVCEHFFVPGKTGEDLSGSIKFFKDRNPGVELMTRKVRRKGVDGVEVWRTK